MSQQRVSVRSLPRNVLRLFRLVPVLLAAFLMVMVLPVLTQADSISFNESFPNTATGVASETFSLEGADTGQCATCFFVTSPSFVIPTFGPVTVASSGLFFDASTNALGGSLSFTFLGGGGGTHHDTLTFTGVDDWQLTDVNGSGMSKIFHGDYILTASSAATPEPSSLAFLGAGLMVLAPVLRRRLRK